MFQAVRVALSVATAAAALSATAFAATKTFDLEDFDEIDVSAGVIADVTVGGGYAISVEAEDSELERLRVEVKGRTLIIARDERGMRWTRRRGKIEATIALPALTAAEASSGARLVATGVDAGAFSVEASSGARIEATGRCESVDAEASSGASVDAGDLVCARAAVDVSSGASIRVHATDEVRADASSGGSVRVAGDPPRRAIETSSGGSVRF